MSELKHVSEGPRRCDVFTGAGRRRSFTAAEKASIVEESYAGENTVCGVARRRSLTPQQLLGLRRLARHHLSHRGERSLLAPVMVSPDLGASATPLWCWPPC